MTRKEFEAMSYEEFLAWAQENISDLTSEEILIEFAKTKINDENIGMAIHVLGAIYNNPHDTEDYLYDYSMGTLETPTPVTCKEDFEHLIDFDDDEPTIQCRCSNCNRPIAEGETVYMADGIIYQCCSAGCLASLMLNVKRIPLTPENVERFDLEVEEV